MFPILLVFRNGKEVRIETRYFNPMRILVSKSRTNKDLESKLDLINIPKEVIKKGGSLKIVEVAKGKADLFICPIFSVMHLWDLCAPQIILTEAGGRITNIHGRVFDYFQRDTANNQGVVAGNYGAHEMALQLLEIAAL